MLPGTSFLEGRFSDRRQRLDGMEDRCTERKLPVSVCYCLAGPGGEDLEGGYYDAGDNLKVHIIFYV